MTNHQNPVTPVIPLHQRGTEHPTAAPHPDTADFFMLVKDTLGAMDVDPDTIKAASRLIAAAHDARMEPLRNKQLQSQRAADAYAVMDRTNQSVLQVVKRSIGQYLEINARQHAHNEMLSQFQHDVRQLVKRAIDHQVELVPLKQLQELLDRPLPEVPHTPIIVGMAPDSRFRYGVFGLVGSSEDVTAQRTFVGWSLVVQRPLIRSTLEPTFMDADGNARTASSLHYADGLLFKHLV